MKRKPIKNTITMTSYELYVAPKHRHKTPVFVQKIVLVNKNVALVQIIPNFKINP